MNAKRILLSPGVLIAALAIFGLYTLTGVVAQDVVNSYKAGTDYYEMLIFLAAIPAVGVFAQDWRSKFWRLIAVRISIRRYAVSLFLWTWITTFCTAMLGQWLYIAYLGCRVPVLSAITFTQPWESDYLGGVLYRFPYFYLWAQTLCASLVCGTFSIAALYVSVKIPDKLVAFFSPVIVYYAVSFVSEILGVPYFFRPDYQLIGYLLGDSVLDTLIMSIHVFIPAISIPLFIRAVERRCENA